MNADERHPSAYINRDYFQEFVSCDDLVELLGWIEENALIEGAHHKQWVLDQILRQLLQGYYTDWRKGYNANARRHGTPRWDTGIAP